MSESPASHPIRECEVLWARFRVHLRGLALRKAVGSLRGQLAEALAAEAYALAEGDEIEAEPCKQLQCPLERLFRFW